MQAVGYAPGIGASRMLGDGAADVGLALLALIEFVIF